MAWRDPQCVIALDCGHQVIWAEVPDESQVIAAHPQPSMLMSYALGLPVCGFRCLIHPSVNAVLLKISLSVCSSPAACHCPFDSQDC